MYQSGNNNSYQEVLDKVSMKTLVHGDRTLMVEFRLEKGADIPLHCHPHEQTGYLVSGCIELTIGDVIHQVKPGGSWCIPAEVEHKALAHEASVAIEVFSPVREDYLPQSL
jgi:quercetin dioxygenase-like cupin family protein